MTTLPTGGKLFTTEQSLRLAMLDGATREKAIGLIAAHLRRADAATARWCKQTPRDWYELALRAAKAQ